MSDTLPLELLFHDRMLRLGIEAPKQVPHYNPRVFKAGVYERGGLPHAKWLLGEDNSYCGFRVLWKAGRLDLTVEAMILEEEVWQPLFTPAELAAAQQRLEDANYQPGS